VEKSGRFFHAMEKYFAVFAEPKPQAPGERHTMEKYFPHCGKPAP
jgi:hypothetical protein